ncbi:hypothetical protein JTB14_003502 [Gonioctena quinquepunctata]|nr:hypothetical protein JTB14_003502 [Gonioctena quinquepunctata]
MEGDKKYFGNMYSLVVFLSIFAVVKAISDGHDSNIYRHKWMLSLQHNNEHFCGATLIASNLALTSAYCLNLHSTNLTVRAGSTSKSSGGQVLEIASTVVHPKYNALTHDSDIALITFSEDADQNISMSQRLPYYTKDIVTFSPVTMTGWGKTMSNGSYPDILQMSQIPTMTRENCQSLYPSTIVNLNMFCAGTFGKPRSKACEGDSGGSGIVYSIVEGIISWGNGCEDSKYPTVFTRVSSYVGWIRENSNITCPGINCEWNVTRTC